MTCAWRRRTEVLLCLPSADEHLLSNTDTSAGVSANTRMFAVNVNQKLFDLIRFAERLWTEIKDLGLVHVGKKLMVRHHWSAKRQ